jgi:uncharacterized membrane protein
MIDYKPDAPQNRLPPEERGDAPHVDGTAHGSAADLFAPLSAHLHELKEYASYYLAARTDLVRAKVRKLVVYAVLGIIAAIVAVTALVVAVVLVLHGIAGGLGELIANRPWAGSLVTGLVLLAIVFGSLKLIAPQWFAISRRKVKEKYDRRRQAQRERFGHDVDQVRKD